MRDEVIHQPTASTEADHSHLLAVNEPALSKLFYGTLKAGHIRIYGVMPRVQLCLFVAREA